VEKKNAKTIKKEANSLAHSIEKRKKTQVGILYKGIKLN